MIENSVGRFWLDEDGIMRCEVKSGTDQTREQAEDSMRIFRQLAAGRGRPAVIVTAGAQGLSREARAVYGGADRGDPFSAVALVVAGSAIARTLGNFVIAVSRPAFPVRMFETLEEALPWARAHLQKR